MATEIRCSALPLVHACPASQGPGIRFDWSDESGPIGSAVHHVMACRLTGKTVDVQDTAKQFNADGEEVQKLVYQAERAWKGVSAKFPNPMTEVPYDLLTSTGIRLTGHIDVEAQVSAELRLADWKSGYADADHEQQMRGYAYLALKNHPECDTAYITTVLIRDQETDAARYTLAELESWWQSTSGRMKLTEMYRPGPQCHYCPRKGDCPAVTARDQNSARVIADWEGTGRCLEPNVVAQVYDGVRALEDACKRARESLRFLVGESGGKFSLGDGRALVLREQINRKIDPFLGMPIVEDYIGTQETLECCTIGKGKVEKAARAMGKGRVTELLDALERAGALIPQPQERLECKREPAAESAQIGTIIPISTQGAGPLP